MLHYLYKFMIMFQLLITFDILYWHKLEFNKCYICYGNKKPKYRWLDPISLFHTQSLMWLRWLSCVALIQKMTLQPGLLSSCNCASWNKGPLGLIRQGKKNEGGTSALNCLLHKFTCYIQTYFTEQHYSHSPILLKWKLGNIKESMEFWWALIIFPQWKIG